MNDHKTRITRADVESVVAKLETFVEGLPLGERAAIGLVLTALPPERPARDDEDVQGSGWFLEGAGALARGIHRLIHGAPSTEACDTAAVSISALGGQQHGIGRQSLQ
ncbi:MAG: hypothetical protein ACRDJE_28225 [Dehalococcoidia bacterium]